MTKEEVYDAQINPLMAQIIAICKEHKIPVLASFTLDLDEGLQCTTSLLEDDWEPADEMLQAARVLVGHSRRSPLMLTVRDGDGKIKSMEAIL
jgi:hypothetical protein